MVESFDIGDVEEVFDLEEILYLHDPFVCHDSRTALLIDRVVFLFRKLWDDFVNHGVEVGVALRGA